MKAFHPARGGSAGPVVTRALPLSRRRPSCAGGFFFAQ